MHSELKNKIHHLVDEIEDERILHIVKENVEFYTSTSDIIDDLSPEKLLDLDAAIQEAEANDTMSWIDLKKEMNEWKQKWS